MSPTRALRNAACACAAAACLALAVGLAAGQWRAGVALAAGLLLGAVNGPWARQTLSTGVSFRFLSLGRLAVLSAAGIGAGALLGLDVAWLPVLGLGAAQMALAGAALVETARA